METTGSAFLLVDLLPKTLERTASPMNVSILRHRENVPEWPFSVFDCHAVGTQWYLLGGEEASDRSVTSIIWMYVRLGRSDARTLPTPIIDLEIWVISDHVLSMLRHVYVMKTSASSNDVARNSRRRHISRMNCLLHVIGCFGDCKQRTEKRERERVFQNMRHGRLSRKNLWLLRTETGAKFIPKYVIERPRTVESYGIKHQQTTQ